MKERSKPASDASIPFGHRIRTLARSIDRALALRIRRRGITLAQFYVIRELAGENGLTQRELSLRINAMESGTVTLLRRMEALGLIERVRDGEDRRRVNVSLSAKGCATRDAIHADTDELNLVMRRGITKPELRTLRTLLDRIESNLET
jgi:DNA-binding MarR family transcriptional regulator